MKPSKKVWIIIAIGIFAIVLGSLYTFYFREVREREHLSDRLAAAEAILPGLTADREELEDRLAQAESLLDKSRREFPEVVESIEYGEDFFKIAYGENLHSMAAGCGVELTRLTAAQPTGATAGGVTYSVSSFMIVVEGGIDNILDFIDAIGTGIDYELSWNFQLPWSVDVKSVNINIMGEEATATISLDIYGYKGT
jgi:hypothetical protein